MSGDAGVAAGAALVMPSAITRNAVYIPAYRDTLHAMGISQSGRTGSALMLALGILKSTRVFSNLTGGITSMTASAIIGNFSSLHTAAELVTPGGNLVRANAGHEPDLFWAVRGGGGVGVVTALEMRLYPVRELYAGDLFFPIQRAAEVLHAWREWTATVPDEVTSICHLLRLPPLPELPEPLRGRAFAIFEAACLGDAGTGAELIGPLRRLGPEVDTFAMIPAAALGQLNMDPSQPVPGEGDGAFLADFPAAAIDALVPRPGPCRDTAASVEIRHLGGALARPVPEGGAQPSIDASYLLYAAGPVHAPTWPAPRARTCKRSRTPWHPGTPATRPSARGALGGQRRGRPPRGSSWDRVPAVACTCSSPWAEPGSRCGWRKTEPPGSTGEKARACPAKATAAVGLGRL